MACPGDGEPPTVSYRRYREDDIPHCARLAREAWPARESMSTRDHELLGMEDYMRYSRESSNWAEVAHTRDGMVGFLFGRIDGLCGEGAPPERPQGELPSVFTRLLRRTGVSVSTVRLLWSLALTEIKLRLKTPDSGASVEMFIVGSRHRGKGVGTELLDRFLSAARDAGASVVTVYTDDLMSDWRFYERRGFSRVATFHDNITSYYSGTPAKGIVFALELEPRQNKG